MWTKRVGSMTCSKSSAWMTMVAMPSTSYRIATDRVGMRLATAVQGPSGSGPLAGIGLGRSSICLVKIVRLRWSSVEVIWNLSRIFRQHASTLFDVYPKYRGIVSLSQPLPAQGPPPSGSGVPEKSVAAAYGTAPPAPSPTNQPGEVQAAMVMIV